MWKPTGNMHIVDLDKSCFLVKFSVEQDYFKALTGGSWILLDNYLLVHQWDPSFRVSNDLPKRMVAWIRFPHLPIHLYHGQVLTALGNLVGKTVKIDSTTQTAERGKFAVSPLKLTSTSLSPQSFCWTELFNRLNTKISRKLSSLLLRRRQPTPTGPGCSSPADPGGYQRKVLQKR
ncbi:hypothetical protein LINPERHAP1_LOCUS36319 [Linum perenne]